MNLSKLRKIFEGNRDRFVSEWSDLLRFKSVSADDRYRGECLECAQWLRARLERIGFQSQLLETFFNPVVFADRRGDLGKPTVLCYGHYDVQPADPIEAWQSPPFEPQMRNNRLYARGAADNKGQHFYVIAAIESLLELNALRCGVKVFLEGGEECASRGTTEALSGWGRLLKSDILLVTDSNAVGPGIPTIVMGLRGVAHLTVRLSGPSHDLHSGTHGGVAPNPAVLLARLISSLHDDNGSIAVKGFYDGLPDVTDRERKLANFSFAKEGDYEQITGVPPVGGEKGCTPAERAGFRPSIDVNGIASGYSGAGMKTIIPSSASAKITARLVAGQNPESCLNALIAHLESRAPDGLRLEITEKGIGGPGLRLSLDSRVLDRARAAFAAVSDNEPVYRWEGASIPVVSSLARVSGAEPLLAGFGLEEDNAHAANESFSVEQFRDGFMFAASLLAAC